jgi:hypothetical protein
MRDLFHRFHLYLESIPDRLYPFTSEIEGTLVRGRASYQRTMQKAFLQYGQNQLGFRLIFYRSIFHIIGSIIFIFVATAFSQYWFGSEAAVVTFLVAAMIALFIQEFFVHPKRYGQPLYKSFADWLTWAVPMMLYLSFM